MEKRDFIKNLCLGSLAIHPLASSLERLFQSKNHISPLALANDEDFWADVRKAYRLKPDYINLENGYYNILPQETLERYIEQIREINYQGSWYMRTVQFENRRKMAGLLANLLHCEEGEVGITRNTTESLDLIIQGFPWKEGDEALMASTDYGSMLQMFKLTEKRQGIKAKVIDIPLLPNSDEEIVNAYRNAITPNTKLLMICHIVNVTGQILPVRKICDMAHNMGVKVMVDGAHAVGQIEFSMKELDCDFYGASLHKWLSVPLGVGLLFVKQDSIKSISPLLAGFNWETDADDDIRRINHIGTHPVHNELAVSFAIDFYQKLGPAKKEARLRYLQQYWTSRIRTIPGIILNTPSGDSRACAIANVGIEGIKPSDMAKTLLDKYKIYTVAIDSPQVKGCRITPNVFTTTRELDALVAALKEMAA